MDVQDANYPTGKIAGIADERDEVEQAVTALKDQGVDPQRIEVLQGAKDADELDVEPSDADSLAGGMVRVAQYVFGDETEGLKRLTAALERGAYVMLVDVDSADDEEVSDERKRELADALEEAGLTSVAYYGQWQVEDFGRTI